MKCTAPTRSGSPCPFTATYGALCVSHAASARVPEALAEQARRLSGGRDPFARYAADPCAFAREALGLALWRHQNDALAAIASSRRVAWRSAHGAGKSVTAAVAAIWFVVCRPDSLALVTAPTARQVRTVLWRTIRTLVRGAKVKFDEEIPESPELGWSPFPGRLLVGLTAEKPEAFVGLHARETLVVVDEASGVAQPIHEAIRGSLTGDSRLLMISNPSQQSGEFFDAFGRKAPLYTRLHTSAADVIREAPGVPGLIDQTYVDELIADYGERSAVVAIKIHGEFPTEQADSVIPASLVDEARARWSPTLASGTAFAEAGALEIGVDVARFGDDQSCVVARRGKMVIDPVCFSKLDGNELAGRILAIVERLRAPGERPIVRIDSIGVGAAVIDRLSLLDADIDLQAINVSEASSDDRYERLRDELWFRAAMWLRDGGALPPDEKLIGELLAPCFGFTPRGRQRVEPKDETKRKLRRSPDRADAFCLAVYTPPRARGGAWLYDDIEL